MRIVYLKVILFSRNIEVIELLMSDSKKTKKKVAVACYYSQQPLLIITKLLIQIRCRYL